VWATLQKFKEKHDRGRKIRLLTYAQILNSQLTYAQILNSQLTYAQILNSQLTYAQILNSQNMKKQAVADLF
jgi:hypothetical protein